MEDCPAPSGVAVPPPITGGTEGMVGAGPGGIGGIPGIDGRGPILEGGPGGEVTPGIKIVRPLTPLEPFSFLMK